MSVSRILVGVAVLALVVGDGLVGTKSQLWAQEAQFPFVQSSNELLPGFSQGLQESTPLPERSYRRFDSLLDNLDLNLPGSDRPRPGPNIPEPMVFDLIRPLGVRQGELEVNVLGFVPLRRTRTRTPQFSFITGSDRNPEKRPAFEWAPEIEYGLFDNFALEFEIPMADGKLEAYKLAAQYTLGTGTNEQFIHGFQGILFIDRTNGAVSPTLLYLAGFGSMKPTAFLGCLGLAMNSEATIHSAQLRCY